MDADRRFFLTAHPLLEWVYGELHRGAAEENSWLLKKIKGLEAQLEKSATAVEENSRLLRLIKELEA